MTKITSAFRALLALATTALGGITAAEAGVTHWVDGYYVGYEHDLYPPDQIDFSSMTHIMVGRYAPNPDGTLDKSCDWDAALCPAWAKDIGVRAHKAKRKAILFLGGAGSHDGFVAATKPAVRAKFIKNVVAAVKSLNFDGVDVDWEPIEVSDRNLLVQLLKDLRKAMPGKLITMPVEPVNINFPTSDYAWYKRTAPFLDQFNVMTYDMDGSDWGWTKTWFSSAITGATEETPTSVVGSIDMYLKIGIPAEKLGIGMGFYGQCWTGGVTGPRQLQGDSAIIATDGEMSFANIMDKYFVAANDHYDRKAGAAWLGSAAGLGPNKCTYISYENDRSVTAKASLVKKRNIGGAIIWTISQGWRPEAGTNSVLKAAGTILK